MRIVDHVIRKDDAKTFIGLRFGFWKKPTLDKKDIKEVKTVSEEAQKKKVMPQRLESEETKGQEVQSPQDNKQLLVKFEENQNYVVVSLTKAGGTLVLKAEQSVKLWEDVRKEIATAIEENERIKQLLQNKKGIESDVYLLAVGNFHYFKNVPHNSLEFYDNILERKPNKISALNNKGVVLDSLGRHTEALECYNKALKTHPENAHISCNMGISLYKEGKYMEALKSFDRTLRVEPLYSSAIAFKAHALSRLERKDEALEFYNRALLSDPDNAELLYNKARICSLKGMKQEALLTLEKAIGMDQRWKTMAVQNEDFVSLKKNQKFLALVQ
ncbi:MAG: tetratricopeptide repeat protein [Rhabdochlamydiaceae bacterium]